MASNKDILDAQQFNKRRLIAAFTSGAPEGREVELKSPTGPLVVGVLLTVIILVGAWVWGRFQPALPQGWENGSFITATDTGAQYYSIEGTLHPVRNSVSAQLLSGSGQLTRTSVASSALEGIPRGPEIGIVGAPSSVPSRDALVNSGWTACPADGSTQLTVSDAQVTSHATNGALVRQGERVFLVRDGWRHEVAAKDLAAVRIAFAWEGAETVEVPTAWLDLFDAGTALAPLTFPEPGAPVTGFSGSLTAAVKGSVVEVVDGQTTRHFVVTGSGELTTLSEVAFRMYMIGEGALRGNPLRASVADIAGLTVKSDAAGPSDWPQTIPTLNAAGTVPCAVLSRTSDTTQTLVQQGPSELPAPGVVVTGGTGALVRATAGGSLGSVHLITDAGLAFGLAGDVNDVVQRLGYQDADIANVPADWLRLIPAGPALSPEAAWESVPVVGQ